MFVVLGNAFFVVPNKKFKTYITMKKIPYDEIAQITPKELLSSALGKHTLTKIQGTWNARSDEEEHVVTLSEAC